MTKIRVFVTDDHALVRMGLITLLQMENDLDVVGEAEDGRTALKKIQQLKPDVVVMDLMMPGMDGIETTRQLQDLLPSAKTLILTTSSSSTDISNALQSGASGAILKSAANAELLSAIRAISGGKRYISPCIQTLLLENPPIPTLTEKQREILQSITRGLTNPDIAKQFGISVASVKDHINLIFSKLGAANRSEAVTIALRNHLLKI
jgi:DNA-binding NarL/FixJ family response regulator